MMRSRWQNRRRCDQYRVWHAGRRRLWSLTGHKRNYTKLCSKPESRRSLRYDLGAVGRLGSPVNDSLRDEELVAAYLRHVATKDDSLFWAWERLQEYIAKEPRKAWELTLQLIAAAPDASAIAYVAAGPLEDLLYARGALFVDEVERLASSDLKFLSALRRIAGPFTSECDTSNRIVNAAGVHLPCIDEEWP